LLKDAGSHGCLPVPTPLWSARGLRLSAANGVADDASWHRDCGSGLEPCRLLLVFLRRLQVDAPNGTAPALTSLGPGCKTPCSLTVPVAEAGFSVTYTLNKFQPVTVPVLVIHVPGDFSTPASTTVDPNPVIAELQPAGPPPRARSTLRPKKPKPKATAAAPAASPFPDPASARPAAAPSR
jgi:hypothetical protein